jgi:prolyl-tRNA editing enzyme YbaK/EbsC (Cys-tRNA(Pro) deacylase)
MESQANDNRMNLSQSALRVQQALQELGLSLEVLELPASTRTSQEAAQAIGCMVGQIAKSIIFRGLLTDQPIMVIASGPNHIEETIISGLRGETIRKADADYVRQHTGFAIGGVPPLGHAEKIIMYLDQDLFQYQEIWAAAGTPRAVFRLTPQDLVRMTSGIIIRVTG